MSLIYITPRTDEQRDYLFAHFQSLLLTQQSFDYMCNSMVIRNPVVQQEYTTVSRRLHRWIIGPENGVNAFSLYATAETTEFKPAGEFIQQCINNYKPLMTPMEFKYGADFGVDAGQNCSAAEQTKTVLEPTTKELLQRIEKLERFTEEIKLEIEKSRAKFFNKD